MTSAAADAQLATEQLHCEQQVVHSALQEGAGEPPCPEAEGQPQWGPSDRGLYSQEASTPLEGEGGRGLAAGPGEARQAATPVCVLVLDQQGPAYSSILAAVVVAAGERVCAGLAAVQPAVLAALGAKASEATALSLADATILAWLLLTHTNILLTEKALRGEHKGLKKISY